MYEKLRLREPVDKKRTKSRISLLLIILVLGILYQTTYSGRKPAIQLPSLHHNLTVGSHSLVSCAPGLECGYVAVPMDYFNPDAGTAQIALARRNATKLPRKGSIFINPGGPGGSGVDIVTIAGDLLAFILGPEWDIIGFDPRGIGSTIPTVRCFPDLFESQLLRTNTVLENAITVDSTSNLSSPALREQLVEQYRQFLTLHKVQAELCKANVGDDLKFMGTVNVVRDMDVMAEVFDGPGAPINYWGGSYGTVLGAYLVNMLPDRVGYVAIDGVADPVTWANSPSHLWPLNWLEHTEKTYEMFLKDCAHAGPSLCPLAKSNEDWRKIERRLENFFDNLALSPLPVPFGIRPGFLTSGAARGLLLVVLYSPSRWPWAAQAYSEAIAGNGTTLYNAVIPNYIVRSWKNDLSRLAVTCLDSPPPESCKDYPTAEDLAEQGLKTLREKSIHFGVSTGFGEPDGGCQYWPVRGPERFTGPWNATLRKPMLIVGNTADPITPLTSALKVNSLMPNSSVLIIQDGPGHCSLALPSLCTAKLVRAYFSGETPKNGTICPVDVSTFPDPEEQEARLQTLPTPDRQLLSAIQGLAEYFARG